MDQPSLTLEKLRRASSQIAEEERSPNMTCLLRGLEMSQEALASCMASDEQRDAGNPGAADALEFKVRAACGHATAT